MCICVSCLKLKYPLDNYNIICYGGYMEAKLEYYPKSLDYTLFEADPEEEAELVIFNEEYIHLKQLDQELHLRIFKYQV